MFSILVWSVYGIFVGSIAKTLVPGEEKLGFFQTVALGICGSYAGGAIMYLLGQYSAISPAGLFMGVVGSVLSLVLYKKITNKE
jgi:uncharacterized membrane protein YeaQ/YmgE (transglycosylase-associated protein family)